MREVVALAKRLARALLNEEIEVRIANEFGANWVANYAPGSLAFNYGRLGAGFFEGPRATILDLVIHEFGHHYVSNHLSVEFYRALTDLRARMTELALAAPELFAMADSAAQRRT